MEYHGKLYGKIGNKYFDTGKSSADFDKQKSDQPQIQTLEAEKKELLEALERVHELVTDFTADYLISLLMIEDVSEKAIQKHKK